MCLVKDFRIMKYRDPWIMSELIEIIRDKDRALKRAKIQRKTRTRNKQEILGLFVCGISLTCGQLINELFPDCTRSYFSQVVSCRRGGDRIYEMRCLFVAVGLNARFIVLPHWDNIS